MSQSQIHYTEHSAEIHTAARIHHLSPTGCTAVQADEQFEFRRNLWHQKTKNFVIQCGIMGVNIRLAVLIQYRSVSDRQTDTRRRHKPR